ncbi:MAG: leucine-rich repeat protein [Clostridia bacterium]|nr:leucine-rich repeat protein [Clostridia bacterium]
MTKRAFFLTLVLIAALMLSGMALADENMLSAPALSLVSSSVTRGEFLRVNVGEVPGANGYWARVYNADGEGDPLVGGYSSVPGVLCVPTARLEPGTYTVKAYANNENEGEHSPLLSFTVTAYTGSAPVVRLSKNTAKVREYVQLSFYIPGASFIRLFCEEEPDLDWWSQSDAWAYNIFMGAPGEYHFSAEGYGPDGSVTGTDTVVLTHTADGELGEPEMDLQAGAVPAGQDLTVNYSFGNATGANGVTVRYAFELFDRDTGEDVFFSEDLTRTGSVTVPGSALVSPHRYTAYLYTFAENSSGFPIRQIERNIFAAASQTEDLSLTVNGQSEITLATHENAVLTIHAPGATAIHLFKGGDDDWDYWGDRNGYYEDIYYDWNYWTEETVSLYLEVCYDPDFENENAEWVCSAPLIVHVTAEDRLAPPQFTVPATVQVGSVLDVEVTELDENAIWCWADVEVKEEGGSSSWVAHGDIEDGHIYLPTGMMEPGRVYIVSLSCSAPGWIDSPYSQRCFTAAGSPSSDPQFAVTRAEVDTEQNFTYLGYVPGARFLRVYVNGDPEEERGFWEGDRFTDTWLRFDRSGDYALTLAALYADGWESWEDWTVIDTVTVRVNAPHGDISLSGVNLPYEHQAGGDMTLDFSSTPAERFGLHLWREHDGNWEWGYDGEDSVITVPCADWEEDIYHYGLDMSAPGYEYMHMEGTFALTGRQSDITLTLSKARVQCSEEFQITVDAPGATAVSWWIPNYDERIGMGSHYEDSTNIRGAETAIVYARACYDPIDWDNFNWDNWREDLNWGPISAVHVLEVTAPNGEAGQPEVSGVPAEVDWGDTLHVTVGAATGAAWYHVRVYSQWDNWERAFFELDGPGSFDYDTTPLDPGDYRLNVYVAGELGYSQTGVDIPFRVRGTGQCGVTYAIPAQTSVPRGQMLEISYSEASETVWYDVRIRDNRFNEYCYFRLETAGVCLLPTENLAPGEYFVIISTGAPGMYWNEPEAADAVRFTVTEGSGSLWLQKTEVLINEMIVASVYAPGAERIRFTHCYENQDNPNWWDENGWETDNWRQEDLRWDWPAGQTTVRAEGLYNGAWQLIGQQTVNVTVMNNYDEAHLRALVPSVVSEGEDLVFSLSPNIGGLWAVLFDDTCGGCEVYRAEGDHDTGRTWHVLHDVDDPAMEGENYWLEPEDTDGYEVRVPHAYLKRGHAYHMDIEVYSNLGVFGRICWNIPLVIVSGQTDGNVSITVDGTAEDRQMLLCEDYRVEVSAPDATAIRVYNGHEWHYSAGDRVTHYWNDGSDGLHTLFAEACYDDTWSWDGVNWDEWDWNACGFVWGGRSNQIVLNHYGVDGLDRPEAVLLAGTVARGEFIEVQLLNMDPEAHYDASVWWPDGAGEEFWPLNRWYEQDGDIIRIPTVDLEPGEWRVRVNAGGKVGFYGNNNGGNEPIVTVTDSANGMLNFSKYQVQVNERFTNSARVPGASEITTTINEPEGWQPDNWDNVWQFGPWQGDVTSGDALVFGNSGVYTVKLYARFGDGPWQYTGVSRTVTVTADVVYDLNAMIPVSVPAGQDLVLDLSAASSTMANVYDETTGGTEIYWMNWDAGRESDFDYFDTDTGEWAGGNPPLHSENGNFVLPAQYLKTGHTYRVDLRVRGQNLEADDVYGRRFGVLSGTSDSRVQLVAPDVTDVYPGGDYSPWVDAPDADEIIIYCNGDRHPRGSGDCATLYLYYDEGTYSIWGSARFGNEWVTTDIRTVTFHNQGRLDMPQASAAASVPLHQYLQVSIGELPGGDQFIVDIIDENGRQMPGGWGSRENGNLIVPVYIDDEYEEGKTYFWAVSAMSSGYDGSGTPYDHSFTVTAESANVFAVENPNLLCGEDVHFVVRYPGAEKLRIRVGSVSPYTYWPSSTGIAQEEWDERRSTWDLPEGDYTLRAQYYNGSSWKNFGTALSLTMVELGELDVSRAQVPTEVPAGSDLIVRNLTENLLAGAWYHVKLIDQETDEELAFINSHDNGFADFVTFPAQMFQIGRTYRVEVENWAFGYEASSLNVSVQVVEAVLDTPTFVLPDFLTSIEEEAFCGFTAEVVLIPGRVTDIGARAFADAPALRQIYIPSNVTSIAGNAFENDNVMIFGQPGTYAESYAADHGIPFVPWN